VVKRMKEGGPLCVRLKMQQQAVQQECEGRKGGGGAQMGRRLASVTGKKGHSKSYAVLPCERPL